MTDVKSNWVERRVLECETEHYRAYWDAGTEFIEVYARYPAPGGADIEALYARISRPHVDELFQLLCALKEGTV